MISTDSDCTIGYIKGGCELTICFSAYVDEVWKSGLKGENVILWCYAPRHKNGSDDSDSDEDVTKLSRQKKCRKLTVMEEKNKNQQYHHCEENMATDISPFNIDYGGK